MTFDQLSQQMTEGFRRYPIDDHGKMRMSFFEVPALTVALADGGTLGLLKLASGRKRILPHLSFVTHSAFGAGRTLDIGHGAFLAKPYTETALDADAYADGLDVSGAGTVVPFSTDIKLDQYSLGEIEVFATVLGGTMPIGATLTGCIAYLYE